MRLIIVTTLALLLLAASASGEVRTLAEVHTPDRDGRTAFPAIDAFEGRVVWSDYDATVDAWRLMEHARGVTRAVPVRPRATPFDVDLGPDGSGGTLAVYSRCARGLRQDLPTPQQWRAGRYGCDVYGFSFRTGREAKLVSSRADEYWPSVWGSRIAFVRGYRSRRDPDRTATPYLYVRDAAGTRRVRRPSPMMRASTMIEQPELRGRTVVYAWRRYDFTETHSFIYRATTGGALRPMARGAAGADGAAVHARTIGSPWLGRSTVAWLFQNSGDPEYFGAFARRGAAAPRASQPTKAVAFAGARSAAYFIDGGPGARFDAVSQPGGTFPLKVDDDVAYRRMPRGWQWVRPPRS